MREYISAAQAALRWGVSVRHAERLLKNGRIKGAKKIGNSWLIPADAPKPQDPRIVRKQTGKVQPTIYLPYVFASAVIPMPKNNACCVTEGIEEPYLKEQYKAELNYLRGDFKAVKEYFYTVKEDCPAYICACAETMTAAVSSADYALFKQAKEKLEQVIASAKSEADRLYAQTAVTTIYVSLLTADFAPEWMKKGDFLIFGREGRPWAVYLYAKYLQSAKQFAALLAVSQTALAFCRGEEGFTALDIYFRLTCAAACNGLGDKFGVKRWLNEALEIALPNGFITPFKETIMTFGGALEECLLEGWQDYYEIIAREPDNIWMNWIAFHNVFLKENITLVLNKQEYRLAQHLVNGASYVEAATAMGLSEGRIKNLASTIYGKLFIKSRKELKRFIL